MSITIRLTASQQGDFTAFYESVLARDIWEKMIGNGKGEEEVLAAIKTLRDIYEQVQRARRAVSMPTYGLSESRAC